MTDSTTDQLAPHCEIQELVADILCWKAAMQNLEKHESAPHKTVLILIYSSVL